MPLQLRRGNTAEVNSITPLVGEIVYDTQLKRVVVGDGSTAGGIAIAGVSINEAKDAAAAALLAGTHQNIEFTYNSSTKVISAKVDILVHDTIVADAIDTGAVKNGSTIVLNVDTATLNGNVVGNINGVVTGTAGSSLIGNVTGDVKGSVFGDDSSLLVDGVASRIVGPVYTATLRSSEAKIVLGTDAAAGNYSVSIGYEAGLNTPGDASVAIGLTAGRTNQSNNAVAIGRDSAYNSQGDSAVAIGFEAGNNNQGTQAVAIGYRAGYNNQTAGSIVINASGGALNGSAAGLFVSPIRSQPGTGNILQYDTTTKEITYSSSLEGDLVGSVFADNSTLLVDGVSGLLNGLAITEIDTPRITINRDDDTGLAIIMNSLTSAVDSASGAEFRVSRGSLASPTNSSAGDPVFLLTGKVWKADVSSYSLSSAILSIVGSEPLVPLANYVSGELQFYATDGTRDVFDSNFVMSYNGSGELSAPFVESRTAFQLPIYADDTARSTAIPSPATGMMIFMQSGTTPVATNNVQVYTGAAWVNL